MFNWLLLQVQPVTPIETEPMTSWFNILSVRLPISCQAADPTQYGRTIKGRGLERMSMRCFTAMTFCKDPLDMKSCWRNMPKKRVCSSGEKRYTLRSSTFGISEEHVTENNKGIEAWPVQFIDFEEVFLASATPKTSASVISLCTIPIQCGYTVAPTWHLKTLLRMPEKLTIRIDNETSGTTCSTTFAQITEWRL